MMKTVHDPIHGSISIEGLFVDIMDRPEMQRLHSVKQLGLGNIVFPGANHTRFEHCMGVYHLSGRMSKALGLDEEDDLAVRSAGFLHDICHAPFSHTLEGILEETTESNHMDLARDLIFGRIPTFMERDRDKFDGIEPISQLLEDNGVSAEQVCDLIAYPRSDMGGLHSQDGDSYFSSKDYLH
ncbi:MAG: HD domain-containing protein, partial [Candidatus Methanomethylophilaceae archaeon]|nr:HD domain-containing protein [Candidatus Methanomethylophilaceae archaeon]